jgi:GT2 family glycosyltransferase
MLLSFVIPTRNRPQELARTLSALGALDADLLAAAGGAEAIVLDNASEVPARTPRELPNGVPVRKIRLRKNQGAAARNTGAAEAQGVWVAMLDDDSHPMDAGVVRAVADAPADVAAVGAEILLPDGSHERGGLPEVFIGCGVCIRRDAFLHAGGYDPAFHFYAEEYDLAAKVMLDGFRVVHDPRFRVEHRKVVAGRDMGTILHRLVRNNGWVEQRYAPVDRRAFAIAATIERYRAIAAKERASEGFEAGLAELLRTMGGQPRREMSAALYDRFTGLTSVRRRLDAAIGHRSVRAVAMIEPGKNDWVVAQAIRERGIAIVTDPELADAVVIGTLSPGPIADAMARAAAEHPGMLVIAPYAFEMPAPVVARAPRIAA